MQVRAAHKTNKPMQQLLYDSPQMSLFDPKAECDSGCWTSVFNSREGRADGGHRLWRLPPHVNHSLWTLFSNVAACQAKRQKSELVSRTQPFAIYNKFVWGHGYILICCVNSANTSESSRTGKPLGNYEIIRKKWTPWNCWVYCQQWPCCVTAVTLHYLCWVKIEKVEYE